MFAIEQICSVLDRPCSPIPVSVRLVPFHIFGMHFRVHDACLKSARDGFGSHWRWIFESTMLQNAGNPAVGNKDKYRAHLWASCGARSGAARKEVRIRFGGRCDR